MAGIAKPEEEAPPENQDEEEEDDEYYDPLSNVGSLSGEDDVDGIAFETKTLSLSEQYALYN